MDKDDYDFICKKCKTLTKIDNCEVEHNYDEKTNELHLVYKCPKCENILYECTLIVKFDISVKIKEEKGKWNRLKK